MVRFFGFLVTASAAAAITAVGLPAQSSHPDFSGHWTLVAPPSVEPDGPLWGEGTISQSASDLSVAASVPSGSRDSGRLLFRLDSQGTERMLQTVLGDTWRLVSHARWDANALVITTTYRTPIGQWDDLVALSLDASGDLSVVIDQTPKQLDAPRSIKKYTYRKQ